MAEPAGREHRVEDQAQVDGRRVGQLVVVLDRPQRPLVAEQAQVPDLGGRHQLEHRVDHPEAGPQDRDEPDPLAELVGGHRLDRRPDLERSDADVGQRLVAEQPRQLADDLAELLRLGRLVAQDRELVQDGRDAARRAGLVRARNTSGRRFGSAAASDRTARRAIVAIAAVSSPSNDLEPGRIRDPSREPGDPSTLTAPAIPRPQASDADPSARGRGVPPVLVRQVRNGIEESVHRGDIVEVDAAGRLIRLLGDPDRVVTLRSTVKPFGALALIEAGGIEAFDLEPPEIAILASSHSGEDLHVRTLQGAVSGGPASARRSSPAAPRGCRSTR